MSRDMVMSPHGVSAPESADTPCPLPPSGWETAASTLDLPAVLEDVAGRAAGPLGRARILGRRPTADLGWITEELGRVGEILGLLRRGDSIEVQPVPDIRPALLRLRAEGSVLDGADLAAVRLVLTAARRTAAELRRCAEQAPATAALLAPLVDRGVEKRLEESVDEDGEVLDGASPALRAARRAVHTARDRLVRKLETILRGLDAQAGPPDAAVTLRGGRYVIPVRRDSRARPAGIVHDESGSLSTLFIEPTAAIELGNTLRAALADETREVTQVLRELSDTLRPHADTLGASLDMCAAVDDVVARGRYAHQMQGEVPEMGPPGGPMRIRQGRHPLLVATGRPVVPFDLALDDAERTVLISGPNTGGKTVLLKAVGLVALLVQCGIVPPVGGGTVLAVVERFFADIGDHQSIAASLSTFSAHVAVLRQILEEADAHSLVLLDEVGSGTDPAEGAALAAAALRTLHGRGVMTLATTHLGVLKTLAASTPGLVNGSLEFDTGSLTPTYRFQKGIPGRSYGLAIARRLGVDASVLAQAERDVPEGERALETLLESVEARDRALRERQDGLDALLAEAERTSARLARDAANLTERESVVQRQEREAESRARKEARAYLLDARNRVEEALRKAAAAVDEAAARAARRTIEEGIQGPGGAGGAEDAEAAEDVPGAALIPGVRVRLQNGAVGQLAEIRGDRKAAVLVSGVRLVVPATTLAVLPPREPGRRRAAAVEASYQRPDAPFEIDLRGMRVDEAEMATLAALDAAVLAEHPHLRIIHGMGTGVLRDAVRKLVGADRRVAGFEFAPRHQGGTGVTIVRLQA